MVCKFLKHKKYEVSKKQCQVVHKFSDFQTFYFKERTRSSTILTRKQLLREKKVVEEHHEAQPKKKKILLHTQRILDGRDFYKHTSVDGQSHRQ